MVALPADLDQIAAPSDRRWLERSRLRRSARTEHLLARILAALNLPRPAGGVAALRLWEQTGDRPEAWIAAADPVYLEARMNHVRLHAFPEGELPRADLRQLFDLLQKTLGGDAPAGTQAFTSVGTTGYLRPAAPIVTASVSPAIADGAAPDDYLPQGPEAAAHDRLQSEVQMCLHDAGINRRRMEAGALPVNALWFWGGGEAPPVTERAVPALFAEDPVVRGYWRSVSGPAAPWPGSFSACLDACDAGFVAVVPGDREASTDLAELRAMLGTGRLRRLTLLFRDGAAAELRRGDRFRFWRRGAHPPTEHRRP